jgi:hypothetical protein
MIIPLAALPLLSATSHLAFSPCAPTSLALLLPSSRPSGLPAQARPQPRSFLKPCLWGALRLTPRSTGEVREGWRSRAGMRQGENRGISNASERADSTPVVDGGEEGNDNKELHWLLYKLAALLALLRASSFLVSYDQKASLAG